MAACDRFIYLEVLDSAASASPADSGEDDAATPLPDLRKIMVGAINSTSHDDGWTSLSAVGSHINTNDPSFDSRNYGYPKLIELARAQDYVEVEQVAGQPVRVRLRSRPAKKAAAQEKAAQEKAPESAPEKKPVKKTTRRVARKTAKQPGQRG